MSRKQPSQPTYNAERTGLSRRDFLATGLAVPALMASPSLLSAQSTAAKLPELDIAEWSYFWAGVKTTDLGDGPVVNGQQMYVEYQIPAKVRFPYPIVMVHGGGGQGTDWMCTPDGRRGWSTLLLEQGFMVYVVDRPGHGRSPYHPDLHGGWPGPQTLESISGLFTPQRANAPAGGAFGGGQAKGKGKAGAPATPPYSNVKLHNQWPGTGAVGTPELAQLVAGQGGRYSAGKGTGPETQVQVWQKVGAEMLDKIGVPCIIMTHSAGGPFGMYLVEARPNLVAGLVVDEGATGSAFTPQNPWGLISLPMAYDPPVSNPGEIKTQQIQPTPEDAAIGVGPYLIQAEPARKLKNWRNVPVAVYTAEASFVNVNPGAVHFLKQAGVNATELRLKDLGIHGNGHAMMLEKNNREALQPIINWIEKTIPTKNAPVRRAGSKKAGETTAMKLTDQGHFWIGYEQKPVQGGNMIAGQTFVQYLKPAKKRSPYPVVLVHGGAGQGTHYMGLGGQAGWAHYWVQAGYDTYVIDRPGHGRAIYHPDALGEITPVFNFASITGEFKRGAQEPNRRWMGSGDVDDVLVQQFQAGQNSIPKDNAIAEKYWASGARDLLDKIGPAIVMVHSMGGAWGWIAARERPAKVKALLNVEGGAPPASVDPASLKGVPIAYVVAERSGRETGPVVDPLKKAGVDVTALNLKDKGILGNGHFMMFETNRKQVFDAIHGWVQTRVKA